MINHQRKQGGLSLIELMIAITLSLVLTLGVIQIFSSSKQTNRVQGALGGVQENARFALDLLSYDIRMAGNIGCNRSAVVNNLVAGLPAIDNGISGFEEANLGAAVYPLLDTKAVPGKADVIDGTDVIVVRYAAPNSVAVTSATTASVTFTANGDIKKGDPLIISDCQDADVFIADTNIDKGNAGTIKFAATKTYGTDAEVAPLKYAAYYIRQFEGHNNLYRNVVNGVGGALDIQSPEPLLEGVDDMEILYGEDLSANGDGSLIRYVAAGTAGLDMNRVTSVRISLLFSTLDNGLASGDQSYWLNGQLSTIANAANRDKKLYRGFTTTIKLRNQGIGL